MENGIRRRRALSGLRFQKCPDAEFTGRTITQSRNQMHISYGVGTIFKIRMRHPNQLYPHREKSSQVAPPTYCLSAKRGEIRRIANNRAHISHEDRYESLGPAAIGLVNIYNFSSEVALLTIRRSRFRWQIPDSHHSDMRDPHREFPDENLDNRGHLNLTQHQGAHGELQR